MTLAEKILAAHCGRKKVVPGELINVKVDLVLANDITAPIAIKEFRRIGVKKVFDPKKIVMVPDHFVPNKDILSAEQAKLMREFALEQGLIYFEVGQMGIEHVILPEKGLVLPGDVVIGADSHTCTYGAVGAFSTGMGSTDIAAAMATGDIWMKVPPTIKFVYRGKLRKWVTGKDLILHTIGDIGVDGALYAAMEFTGEAIAALSMDSRFTMANMAIEAGGKAGIFQVDRKTLAYVKTRAQRPYKVYLPERNAEYARVIEYDVSHLEPQVAFPHLPSLAAGVPGGPARRAGGGLHQRRGGSEHADMRAVPWRIYGDPGGWREMRFHHQPQFRGPHGQHQVGDLPGQSGGGCCQRHRGADRGAGGGMRVQQMVCTGPGQVSDLTPTKVSCPQRGLDESSPLHHGGGGFRPPQAGSIRPTMVRSTRCVSLVLDIGACRGAQPLCVTTHSPFAKGGSRGIGPGDGGGGHSPPYAYGGGSSIRFDPPYTWIPAFAGMTKGVRT